MSPAGSDSGDSCLQQDGEQLLGTPLLAGHPARGWLVGPICWEGAVPGKYLPGVTALLLNSCIITCTQFGYCSQSGTICRPYPAAWLLRGSRRLQPAAGVRNGCPELAVTGKRSTSVGTRGAAASKARGEPSTLHLSCPRAKYALISIKVGRKPQQHPLQQVRGPVTTSGSPGTWS